VKTLIYHVLFWILRLIGVWPWSAVAAPPPPGRQAATRARNRLCNDLF
jgi:hypothetical protein